MKAIKVKCPRCQQQAEFSPANKFRPFCSERCRLIDLGAWADESYRVPTEERRFDENVETEIDEHRDH